MAVAQSIARPVRTATQMASAAVLVEFYDAFIINIDDRQYAAAIALLTLVVGWAQVLVENQMGVGFLRKPKPAEKPVEIVDDANDEITDHEESTL